MVKSLAGAVLLLALAFVFNPSASKHRTVVEQTLSERSLLSKALGLGAMTAFVADYRSLGVASYTAINGKMVSVGLFGIVFVVQ